MSHSSLDSVDRISYLRRTIQNKQMLKLLYTQAYLRFKNILETIPDSGVAVELGSGGGFIKEIIPQVLTTDVLNYPEIDQIVDATAMPFENSSVRAFFLMDVFHHIPDVSRFLKEAERCLIPNGKIFILDPYPGWVGFCFYRFLHHEPFEPQTQKWQFESQGPLSDANLALSWVVFQRDRKKFLAEFKNLKICKFQVHTPFSYWLSGGLTRWTLAPRVLTKGIFLMDKIVAKLFANSGSFVDIVLEKT